MKNRSIVSVLLLTFVTFGLYGIIWVVKTKSEMNKLGAQIPTAILIIVPFVNIYWIWKYAEGVEFVTKGRIINAVAFLLILTLGVVGLAVLQNEYNGISADAKLANSMAPITVPVSDSSNVTINNNESFETLAQDSQDNFSATDQIPTTESSFDGSESNE